MKQKICSKCLKPRVIWKRVARLGYCRSCWSCQNPSQFKPITIKPRRVASSKKGKLIQLYTILRKKYLMDHSVCHAKIDFRCLQKSDSIHHKCGRIGELFLNQQFWLPICTPCHEFVEKNPNIAKELGLSLNRLTNEKEEKEKLDPPNAMEICR